MNSNPTIEQLEKVGCIVCYLSLGVYNRNIELHHIRKLSTSKKRKNAPVIPLCHTHHRTGPYGVALHAGEKEFEKNFAPVLELLKKTNELIRNLEGGKNG